jgi:serine/threonine protein kinase
VRLTPGTRVGPYEVVALLREAKLAASLAHPNVVALHDVGFHDGKPYFVTELLQGEPLRERLAKGPIPLPKALEWAAQMAQGWVMSLGFTPTRTAPIRDTVFQRPKGRLPTARRPRLDQACSRRIPVAQYDSSRKTSRST